MNPNIYQAEAFNLALPQCRNLSYMVLGITNEAGEVAGKMKKFLRGDGPMDTDAMIKELGDTIWYISGAAQLLGVSLSVVLEKNLEKLKDRNARQTLQGDGDNR